MSDEEATKAVAETAGKALDIVQGVGRFLHKIIGPAAEHVGHALGDWAAFFRLKNLQKIGDRVEEIQRTRRAVGKPLYLPERVALPLLTAASQEDEPTIQEMWAGLIANATDGTSSPEIPKLYITILSNLEPLEALLLKTIHQLKARARGGEEQVSEITFGLLLAETGAPSDRIKLSLANLHRLGCIGQELGTTWNGAVSGGLSVDSEEGTYYPTPLADSLLAACGPGASSGRDVVVDE